MPLRPHHLSRDQRVCTGARAKIEDALASREPTKLPRISNTSERLHRQLRHSRELPRIAKILRPGPASGKDEVASRLLGYRGVRLLNLALKHGYVDSDLDSHHATSRIDTAGLTPRTISQQPQ